MKEDNMSLEEMARLALSIQNACNLSPIVRSFSRVCSSLWRIEERPGTQFVNQHPVIILFLSKLCSLAKVEGPTFEEFGIAYTWAKDLLGEDPFDYPVILEPKRDL
jgi:hypothetical protein